MLGGDIVGLGSDLAVVIYIEPLSTMRWHLLQFTDVNGLC